MFIRKFIFIAVFFMLCLAAYEAEAGIVFARDGMYVVISETDYSLVKTGNLWEDLKAKLDPAINGKLFGEYDTKLIVDMDSDMERDRFLVCIGVPTDDVYDGCIMFKYPELDILGFFDEGGWFVVNSSGTKIYKGSQVYDNTTFAELKNYEEVVYTLPTIVAGDFYVDRAFKISNDACFIDEKRLFTSDLIFDVSTDPPTFLDSMGIKHGLNSSYDCVNQKVLFFAGVNEDETLDKMAIFDLLADKIMASVTMPYDKDTGSSGDYFLSKDIKYIIGDLRDELPNRVGVLRFYDIATNTLKAEINLSIPKRNNLVGSMGFSKSGDLLFYNSGSNKLFVISVKDTKLLKEITLPFTPYGVVLWP